MKNVSTPLSPRLWSSYATKVRIKILDRHHAQHLAHIITFSHGGNNIAKSETNGVEVGLGKHTAWWLCDCLFVVTHYWSKNTMRHEINQHTGSRWGKWRAKAKQKETCNKVGRAFSARQPILTQPGRGLTGHLTFPPHQSDGAIQQSTKTVEINSDNEDGKEQWLSSITNKTGPTSVCNHPRLTRSSWWLTPLYQGKFSF